MLRRCSPATVKALHPRVKYLPIGLAALQGFEGATILRTRSSFRQRTLGWQLKLVNL
jgi:hypothetical protein